MNTMCINGKWFSQEDGAADLDFIRKTERVVPRGKVHAPISSADILEEFRKVAKDYSLTLKNEKAALLKPVQKTVKKDGALVPEVTGGDRYMYIAEVEDPAHPDYALSVGFRNFGDRSLAFSGMCGNSIFVCQNGVCTSIIKPSKMRHTSGNIKNGFITDKVHTIFEKFIADRGAIHGQIELMKNTKLTDEMLGKFVRLVNGTWKDGKFIKNPMIGSANLCRILEELENPSLNSHNDNSCFRLMNACSYVTSHKIGNPNQAAMASRFCNNSILSLIDPAFQPLGDVIDVTEESSDAE